MMMRAQSATLSVEQPPRCRRRKHLLLRSLTHVSLRSYHNAVTDEGIQLGMPPDLVAQLFSLCCTVVGKSVLTDRTFGYLLSHATTGRLTRFELVGLVGWGDVGDLDCAAAVKVICTLAELSVLNLSGSRISDNTFCLWQSMFPTHSWNFHQIMVCGCTELTSSGVGRLLQHCDQLQTLTVANCDVIRESFFFRPSEVQVPFGAFAARQFRTVTELSVSGCLQLSDTALQGILTHLGYLVRLNLCMCESITDKGIEQMSIHSPFIQELNVYGCRRITDKGIESITNLHMMEELNLGGCCLISDAGITRLAASLPRLRGLNLFQCNQLSNDGLLTLRSLRSMRVLSLAMCSGVTDITIATIVEAMPLLRFLSLVNCSRITDAALHHIARHSTFTLRELYLSCCSQITTAGVMALGTMVALDVLDISMCRHIMNASDDNMNDVKVSLLHVSELHF
jgi:hypothetical protein